MAILYAQSVAFRAGAEYELEKQPRPKPPEYKTNLGQLPKSLENVNTILCFGDSLTYYGSQPDGWVTLVQQYLHRIYPQSKIAVVNKGVSGETSRDMLKRIDRDLSQARPQLTVLLVGANDVLRDHSVSEFEINLHSLIQRIHSSGSKVFLCTIPACGELRPSEKLLDPFNAIIEKAAASDDCTLVGLHGSFGELIRVYRDRVGARDYLLTTDGVHFNSAGQRVFANNVLNTLAIPLEYRERVAFDEAP